jgi:hypothetical protein
MQLLLVVRDEYKVRSVITIEINEQVVCYTSHDDQQLLFRAESARTIHVAPEQETLAICQRQKVLVPIAIDVMGLKWYDTR